MISIVSAFELLEQNVGRLPNVNTPLENAVGRTLSQDILADVNSPPHDKSVMDGFAIRSQDVADGQRRLEIVDTIIAGDSPSVQLQQGQASRIMTGAPIPTGSDAVVMVERTSTESADGKEFVTIDLESIAPEKNILRKGVNFAEGQSVLRQGHIIRPTDIGLLAEVGTTAVPTGGRPSVAVLPTGNELVDCDQSPSAGQIRNSNGPMLVAMSQALGLDVTNLGIGRDESDQLKKLIGKGLTHDLLILSGGVSAGTMDLVPGILNELGVQQVFHKVCVKPGKPIWFGTLKTDKKTTCVFGLPGNPVSSLVGFQLFVRAAIRKMMGGEISDSQSVHGKLTDDHETRGNRPTYWPGKIAASDSAIRQIKPLIWRGSSDLFALGEAEGLIYFEADSHHHPIGEQVRFFPFA